MPPIPRLRPRKRAFTAVALAALLCAASAGAEDRLDLDAISITGTREAPKVLYIVPWKDSHVGELDVMSAAGAFDESMSALDREVFVRQIQYYGMLNRGKAVAPVPR